MPEPPAPTEQQRQPRLRMDGSSRAAHTECLIDIFGPHKICWYASNHQLVIMCGRHPPDPGSAAGKCRAHLTCASDGSDMRSNIAQLKRWAVLGYDQGKYPEDVLGSRHLHINSVRARKLQPLSRQQLEDLEIPPHTFSGTELQSVL